MIKEPTSISDHIRKKEKYDRIRKNKEESRNNLAAEPNYVLKSINARFGVFMKKQLFFVRYSQDEKGNTERALFKRDLSEFEVERLSRQLKKIIDSLGKLSALFDHRMVKNPISVEKMNDILKVIQEMHNTFSRDLYIMRQLLAMASMENRSWTEELKTQVELWGEYEEEYLRCLVDLQGKILDMGEIVTNNENTYTIASDID